MTARRHIADFPVALYGMAPPDDWATVDLHIEADGDRRMAVIFVNHSDKVVTKAPVFDAEVYAGKVRQLAEDRMTMYGLLPEGFEQVTIRLGPPPSSGGDRITSVIVVAVPPDQVDELIAAVTIELPPEKKRTGPVLY